jgi:hypothetical protein
MTHITEMKKKSAFRILKNNWDYIIAIANDKYKLSRDPTTKIILPYFFDLIASS